MSESTILDIVANHSKVGCDCDLCEGFYAGLAEVHHIKIADVPIAVCRDPDDDSVAAVLPGSWLVLYKTQEDAVTDQNRQLVLEFKSAAQLRDWLVLNKQMLDAIIPVLRPGVLGRYVNSSKVE